MATGISKEKPNLALTQRTQPSKQSKIVEMLAILCIRRQAKLSSQDFQVFAADLEEFELQDIEVALERLGKNPRTEGETAFPDCGTLLLACRTERSKRRYAIESAEFDAKVRAAQAQVAAESELAN